MTVDTHSRARFLVDEAKIGGIAAQDELWLRGHLADCAECARYAESVDAVVRGLRSFAFECDPAGPARVESAVARYPSRRAPARWWGLAAAVLVLAAAIPYYRGMRQAQRERADAVLMEKVESRVWQAVPVATNRCQMKWL